MCKTLPPNIGSTLGTKFKALAKFCGASDARLLAGRDRSGALKYTLAAVFGEIAFQPNFQLRLIETKGELVILDAAVRSVGTNEFILLDTYLDPSYVLQDLGLTYFNTTGKNFWKIENPSQLEAFFRKYAWLSKVYGRKPLFDKLLDWKDNS